MSQCSYDSPKRQTVIADLARRILEYYDENHEVHSVTEVDLGSMSDSSSVSSDEDISPLWNGRLKLLDFGCGTGLLSQELSPYCSTIVGVDTDPKMVEQFNTKVSFQGIDPIEMSATTAMPSEIDFDVVVSSMVFHHLDDVPSTVSTLVSKLKIGGWLYVADIEGHSHGERLLQRQDLVDAFIANGLKRVTFQHATKVKLWMSQFEPGAEPVTGKDGPMFKIRKQTMLVVGQKTE